MISSLQELLHEQNQSEGRSQIRPLISPNLTPTEVTEFIQAISQMKLPARLSDIDRRFARHTPNIQSIILASEELGLIELSEICMYRYLDLTDLGRGFLIASDARAGILRARLVRIEPFRTACSLLSTKKRISVKDLIRALPRGYSDLGADDLEETSLGLVLINWGVATGLFRYNGKTGKFETKNEDRDSCSG